jgi:hypothetical protein
LFELPYSVGFSRSPLQQKKCGSLTRPQLLQRMITGTGLRAFGPFLIPLLCLEIFFLGTAISSMDPLKAKLGSPNPKLFSSIKPG